MMRPQIMLLLAALGALFAVINTPREKFFPLLASAGGLIGLGAARPPQVPAGPPGAVVKLYEHKNFGGKQLDIYGPTDIPNLRTVSGIDNREDIITSGWVGPGYKLIFYEHTNFGGIAGEFGPGTYPYVGDYWNDKWSSLKVVRA